MTIDELEAFCTPQDITNGVDGSGINPETVDIAWHNLQYIYGSECSKHEHEPTHPAHPAHARYCRKPFDVPTIEELWLMLKIDFCWLIDGVEHGPLAGFDLATMTKPRL